MTRYHAFLFMIPVLVLSLTTFFGSCAMADTQDNQPKVSITVRYSNDTSSAYTILTGSHQKYMISQRYSWSEDILGRYNLQAYSIDNGPVVPINRSPDGNFTLDVLTESNHSIVFFAKPQFEIVMHGTNNATFFPISPTGDNWFDEDSDVQFIIPYVVPSNKEDLRQQLDGWSLDNSDINIISRQESGPFKSPVIHMSSMHRIDLEYKTQYYIKVISNFGRALGTGWYNSGAIVDAAVIPGDDIITSHIFSGWQGNVIGNGNQESVETLADGPKVLVANWSVDYTNVSMIIIIITAILVLLVIHQKRKTPKMI